MITTANRDDVHQVLVQRNNRLDDANEYFAIGLPGLYLAICSGAIGYWPSGDPACSECMAEPVDLESLAHRREAWCVTFVKRIINPADERLPFHHAVCIVAFTSIDHRLDASRARKLHRFLNGALYDCFSDDADRRAAALRWTLTGRDSEVLITCGAIAVCNGTTVSPHSPRLVDLEVVGALAADGSLPPKFRPGHSGVVGTDVGHDGRSSPDTPPRRGSSFTCFDDESVDGREVLYFAEHWAPPCQLAADSPIGLPLSAVVGSSPRPASSGSRLRKPSETP